MSLKKFTLFVAFVTYSLCSIALDKNDFIMQTADDARSEGKSALMFTFLNSEDDESSKSLETNILNDETFVNFAKTQLKAIKITANPKGETFYVTVDGDTPQNISKSEFAAFALTFRTKSVPSSIVINTDFEMICKRIGDETSVDKFISSISAAIAENKEIEQTEDLEYLKDRLRIERIIHARNEQLKKEGRTTPILFFVTLDVYYCPIETFKALQLEREEAIDEVKRYKSKRGSVAFLAEVSKENIIEKKFKIGEFVGVDSLKLSVNPVPDPYGEEILRADIDLEVKNRADIFRMKKARDIFRFNRLTMLSLVEERSNMIEMQTGKKDVNNYNRILSIKFSPIFQDKPVNESNFIRISLVHRDWKKLYQCPPDCEEMVGTLRDYQGNKFFDRLFVYKNSFMNLKNVMSATVEAYNEGKNFLIRLNLTDEGKKILRNMSQKIIEEDNKTGKKQSIAIIVEEKLAATPIMQEPIDSIVIPQSSEVEAEELAMRINKYISSN